MATKAEIIKAQERREQHCETVQAVTSVNIPETEAQKLVRTRRFLLNYGEFVDFYFPHWKKLKGSF